MVGGPETRYAVAPDGVHVAYQVVGDGPIDLVFLFEWMSNVDVQWQEPSVASFLDRLSSFSRLIMLDTPGPGSPIRSMSGACPQSKSGWKTSRW